MAKDNILLITTDQQRFDTLNAWGNQSIFTPHLNYMAAMGISYKNCYASCPICVPSRTTIMTGRQGYESGVVSNATHETFMSIANPISLKISTICRSCSSDALKDEINVILAISDIAVLGTNLKIVILEEVI